MILIRSFQPSTSTPLYRAFSETGNSKLSTSKALFNAMGSSLRGGRGVCDSSKCYKNPQSRGVRLYQELSLCPKRTIKNKYGLDAVVGELGWPAGQEHLASNQTKQENQISSKPLQLLVDVIIISLAS